LTFLLRSYKNNLYVQNRCVFIKCIRAKRTFKLFLVHSVCRASLASSYHEDIIDSHRESAIGIHEEPEDVIVDIQGSDTDIPQEDIIDDFENYRGGVINSRQEEDQESVIQAQDVPEVGCLTWGGEKRSMIP
jgi:hypothetical protein